MLTVNVKRSSFSVLLGWDWKQCFRGTSASFVVFRIRENKIPSSGVSPNCPIVGRPSLSGKVASAVLWFGCGEENVR